MNWKLVERADLDVQKWDELVARTENAALFSFSYYLDAVAENWCALVDENYSVGIALPYSVRAKQHILYTPIFVSYLEILGSLEDTRSMKDFIFANFKIIEAEFKQPILGTPTEVFTTQLLDPNQKRKGQVNRMLNKAKRFELEVVRSTDWQRVFAFIESELGGKFSGMTSISLERLKKAYSAAEQKNAIQVVEIRKNSECVGGIICLESDDQLLYSKGATVEASKENGGMYAAIDAAIQVAIDANKQFDFGGSRVEGVRRFNTSFGGSDLEYFSYRIDKSPLWFRLLREINRRWFKKS